MKNLINSVKDIYVSMCEKVSFDRDSLAHVGVILAYFAFLALVIGYSQVAYITILSLTIYLLVDNKISDILSAIAAGVAMCVITLLLSIAIKPWFIAFGLISAALYYTELGRLVALKVAGAILALISK